MMVGELVRLLGIELGITLSEMNNQMDACSTRLMLPLAVLFLNSSLAALTPEVAVASALASSLSM
jgi:hypothetical protein